MGKNTGISWAHITFNPWWGCDEVSPACDNCYARIFALQRTGRDIWGPDAPRHFFGDAHWNEMFKWHREAVNAGEIKFVFSGSMCDILERLHKNHPDRERMERERLRLWDLMEQTPNFRYLGLTKRSFEWSRMIPDHWKKRFPSNVFPGVTIESERFIKRWTDIRDLPARMKWISYEPALGGLRPERLELGKHGCEFACSSIGDCTSECASTGRPGFFILGGESQPGSRPSHPSWFREGIKRCKQLGILPHFKQHGDWVTVEHEAARKYDKQIQLAMNMRPGDLKDSILDDRVRWVEDDVYGHDPVWMVKVGTHAAGHVLDGEVYRDLPSI